MEIIKVVEPRVNVKPDQEKNHVVLMGGLRVNEQVNPADSFGSVGTQPVQALWTVNPRSTTTIIDRFMKVRAYFEVSVADGDLQLGTNDALRQFPLSSLCDVLTIQINGESISDNLADKLHALMCYGNDRECRQKSVSTTPNAPDSYQEYADWATYGSAKNPLADFGEATFDPRGGFPVEVVDARTFRVVVTEPILMSPFLTGMDTQEEGFVNVNQFNVSYRWKSDLSQILSHSALGNAIGAVSVSMYQAPELLTTFITPDLTTPIPQLQILPYHKSQDYIKQLAPLAPGASTRAISDSIKLSQIPRRLYLFCRHQRSSATASTSDSFTSIDRLSILWNNQSGLFSSATTQDLFEISSRNGLNISYPSWSKYRGGVMCIEFGKDIGLLDNEAPGVQGQYTIQIQMDVSNLSSEQFIPEFYQVFMMEGTFSIAENMGRASLGNLTPQAVLASKESEELDYRHYEDLQGGNFWSGLKGFVNKVSRGVQKGAKVAEAFAPAVLGAFPELAPIAGVLPAIDKGAGAVKGLTGGRLSGGRYSGGRMGRASMRRR
jgi:hypothetical protein